MQSKKESTMTLVEATELLTECHRSELRYHAFGDREVTWTLGTKLEGK